MEYRITRMVVTDTKLFMPGGDVHRWAERVETRFTLNAIREAPAGWETGRVNKSRANAAHPVGSLKAGISGYVSMVGPRHLQTIVSSDAPYSLAVLKGTRARFSRSARIPKGHPLAGTFAPIGWGLGGMYIPANPGWGKALVRQHVRGQAANPFFDRAFEATARTHSSLRGWIALGTMD